MDLPKRDAPKLDLPKLDLPKLDALKRDVPKPNVPTPNVPKRDLAKVDPPKLDLPKLDLSKPDLKVDPPKLDVPKLDLPKLNSPKPDLAMPERQRWLRITTVSAVPVPPMPSTGTPQPAAPGRLVLGAGEPEPPISGRPDGLAASLLDQKRIAPRSPRVALEPDHVPVPTRSSRPSKRARNPLVIVGNAVLHPAASGLVVGGGMRCSARAVRRAGAAGGGPGRRHPARLRHARDRRSAPARRRDRPARLVFVGGVFALKAREELKAGEYLFPTQASLRDVIDTIVEGKVVQHQLTIPEGLTSEQIVAAAAGDDDMLTGNIKEIPARRHAAARHLQVHAAARRASR